jgi:hypothetical protein
MDKLNKEDYDNLLNKLESYKDKKKSEIIWILAIDLSYNNQSKDLIKIYKPILLTSIIKYTDSQCDILREKSIIILGWLGGVKELLVLEEHLLKDNHFIARAWSASSVMQLWLKRKSNKILHFSQTIFLQALQTEKEYFVIMSIIEAISEIYSKRFGATLSVSQNIREKYNEDIHQNDKEKINLMKDKVVRFLNKQKI